MVKRKKSKKTAKKKSTRSRAGKKKNNVLVYVAAAALVLAVIVLAFPGGNQNQGVKKVSKPATEVKDKKVSDIKETKEVKLNIPKKTKAINAPRFNEKAIQIRFAEIDYNSNKKISLKEYLYYFKDKSAGKKKFKSIDKNKDRSITYDEYLSSRK